MGLNELGTLDERYSFAVEINDAGQWWDRPKQVLGQPMLFIAGPNGVGMTDLGMIGGTDSDPYAISMLGR